MTISLYEDNAGGLFLHQEEGASVFQDDPYLVRGANFLASARAVYQGETEDWSEDWVYPYEQMQSLFEHPETNLIATWYPENRIVIHTRPGEAGKRYLQLSDEECDESTYPLEKTYTIKSSS